MTGGDVGTDASPATSVALSPGGLLLAAANDSGATELWDVTEMLAS